MDRLVTYALGQSLSDRQREQLSQEKTDPVPPIGIGDLLAMVDTTIGQVLEILRTIDTEMLFDKRAVGRAGRPSTVIGLLFHAAEHTQRHTGQVITTAKIVKAMPA
jgi:hypothetical protein